MKIIAQNFNSNHYDQFKHIAIVGNEEYLVERVISIIVEKIQKLSHCYPVSYKIDEPSFSWDELLLNLDNFSLFEPNQFFILRSDTTLKKSQLNNINKLFSKLGNNTYIIFLFKKRQSSLEKQDWYKAVNRDGIIIDASPIASYKLPAFINQLMKEARLSTSKQGLELITNLYQSNLLAINQLIKQLQLNFDEGYIELEDIKTCSSNQAQYSIFECIDYALNGNAIKTFDSLQYLKQSKIQPAIILWNVCTELRKLINMKFDIESGLSIANTFDKHHVWQSKKNYYTKQLNNRSLQNFYKLLQTAKQCDASVKGMSQVNDWQSISSLLLKIAS